MSLVTAENRMVIDQTWPKAVIDTGAMTTEEKIQEWRDITEQDQADFIGYLNESYQELLQPLVELAMNTPINCSVTDSKIRFIGKQINEKLNDYCRMKSAEEGY